jgi:Protein of unknown function (DUF3738)
MRISPGRFSATFENLTALISKAYDVPAQLISGGPAWAAQDPFDIETMGKRSAKLTAAKEDERSGIRWAPIMMMGQKVTMASLASRMTRQLGQLVIDNTGLEGEFDFTVDFSPDAADWTMANSASRWSRKKARLRLW